MCSVRNYSNHSSLLICFSVLVWSFPWPVILQEKSASASELLEPQFLQEISRCSDVRSLIGSRVDIQCHPDPLCGMQGIYAVLLEHLLPLVLLEFSGLFFMLFSLCFCLLFFLFLKYIFSREYCTWMMGSVLSLCGLIVEKARVSCIWYRTSPVFQTQRWCLQPTLSSKSCHLQVMIPKYI